MKASRTAAFSFASTGAGVLPLTAGIAELLPAATGDAEGPISGAVFKVERAAAGEKIAYVRMFSGTVRTRDRVRFGGDLEDKVTALSVFDDGSAVRRASVVAGEIGKLWGLGEIQVGVLFSTSGRIADEGWVLLEDDKGMLAADNVTPVISAELQEAYGTELVELLDEVSAALDTATLTELNKRFDIDKEDAAAIAADFITEAGLGA